ncbi:thioredoxin domain-containing protein [Herbiconiux sp. YIM B11900]|uniref:thioredoxin domain-containing protein n=1 Tax=Herbiconiux sp. YIM B11900 TaxID=3404131 RepID=UPI003F87D0AD
MVNRLSDAISPYLRSHAGNPVDWYPWGAEAFAAAAARDVPVLVSIGYSTCHWCHVMARESFSDPALAAYLDEHFVAIKVDREEHPEVDSAYLAAAGAFTEGLGWPLNVFTTPAGKAFFAGTYSPPVPVEGHPSFRQVLDAVTEAWQVRRADVLATADQLAAALAAGQQRLASGATGADAAGIAGSVHPEAPAQDGVAPTIAPALGGIVSELAAYEDGQYGGFGGAPKFPVAPVLRFLLAAADTVGEARALADRTLRAMAASPLRDPVEGGFFRYATRRDWSDPHYERMLYDNAQLLDAYTEAWARAQGPVGPPVSAGAGEPDAAGRARDAAEGIARFLLDVMQLPSGGFASAQDSESTVDGARVEGGYYALDAAARAAQTPPALDEKVLAGWNGLALGALAHAAFVFDRDDWLATARRAADHLLATHVRPGHPLARVSIGDRLSDAAATLEDYGMLAEGLLRLAAVTGSVRYASAGRALLDDVLEGRTGSGDPVLRGQGLSAELDPSEGAYPSGRSAAASALVLLYGLTAERRYREAAAELLAPVRELAPTQPIAFGAALRVLTELARPATQLVLIEPDGAAEARPATPGLPASEVSTGSPVSATTALRDYVRRQTTGLTARATESQARELAASGFELFEGRPAQHGLPTAYRCTDFVCRLPATTPEQLADPSHSPVQSTE